MSPLEFEPRGGRWLISAIVSKGLDDREAATRFGLRRADVDVGDVIRRVGSTWALIFDLHANTVIARCEGEGEVAAGETGAGVENGVGGKFADHEADLVDSGRALAVLGSGGLGGQGCGALVEVSVCGAVETLASRVSWPTRVPSRNQRSTSTAWWNHLSTLTPLGYGACDARPGAAGRGAG